MANSDLFEHFRDKEPEKYQAPADSDNQSFFVSTKNHLKKHRLKYALGAFAASMALSASVIDEQDINNIVATAPYVAGAVACSEAMFIGGVGLIAASQGRQVLTKDILSKEYVMTTLRDPQVEDNVMLRAGLLVNTVGAVGTSVALGYGAIDSLPTPAMIPVIMAASVDLAATYAIRYNIYAGLKQQKIEIN